MARPQRQSFPKGLYSRACHPLRGSHLMRPFSLPKPPQGSDPAKQAALRGWREFQGNLLSQRNPRVWGRGCGAGASGAARPRVPMSPSPPSLSLQVA